MTQLSDHAKSILRAIADGTVIEREHLRAGHWYELPPLHAIAHVGQGGADELRIKPETRSINGVEFAAPNGDRAHSLKIITGGEFQKARMFGFAEAKDRNTAYQAIIDALEGNTK